MGVFGLWLIFLAFYLSLLLLWVFSFFGCLLLHNLWLLSSSITITTKLFQIKEIKVGEFKEMKGTRSKNDKEVDQHVVLVTVDQSNLWVGQLPVPNG